jgi:glucose/arabinose dehydrogenase
VQKLTIAIIVGITFFVGISLMSLYAHLGSFIVQAQPFNVRGLLVNLTDEHHNWKPSKSTNVTQTNGNLTISIITEKPKKIFNRAFLQTQLNTSNTALPILTLDYASKNFLYPPTKKPTFQIEIRDVNNTKILWSAILQDTSGKLLSEIFTLPSNVLNKPINFRIYIITEGGPSHSTVSLKNLYVYRFESSYEGGPIITDPNLKLETFFKGLKFPTSMAFLGPNDLLVLEKNNGTVQRIINGTLQPKPVLDVNVAIQSERGMEGIALTKNHSTGKTYVFLYFTETKSEDGEKGSFYRDLGNRLYRYELDDDKLVNPKLLLDLPSQPCCIHNGGKITIGPDNNVYTVIGDANGHHTKAQNFKNGKDPDGTSAIYRFTQDGKVVSPTLLGDKEPLNKYYAYGIRNSFGLDFDPVTGNLWDTENGAGAGDEINLVEPGFNSGWTMLQGIWNVNASHPNSLGKIESSNHDNLVDFDGRGKYSDPEFTWSFGGVGVTAVKFFNSTKFGKQYENDMFVGDYHRGYLYHFDLSKERDKLNLDGSLRDKVADNITELQKTIFGQGFGPITDIKVGPDGYLYVLTYQGTIYRLVPSL